MSDRESTPTAPRRSGRERKPIKRFSKGTGNKANDNNAGSELNGGQNTADHDDSDAPSGDEDMDEPDYVAPKAPTRGTRRGRGKGRAATTTSRKRRVDKDEEPVDGAKLARDAKISDDSALFNLILSPATALQDSVDNFLELFDNTPEKALADLINCILRSCGCNSSVDSDQVMDTDGVVDALDEFTEGFKTETMPAYPIVSKSPAFRKFRKSLAEFFTRLMVTSAEAGSLYASDLMPTLQAWLVPLSSSQVRSFRHTATVVALYLETALCQIAAGVDKEIQTLSRQKEGERGKKAARSKAREQDLETRINEVTSRRNQLKEYLNDIFNSVFVHRSRDHDAAIRADCVHELGVWFVKHSTYFLESGFLPYLGKTLSDNSTAVRLEAVKSIDCLYSKDYTAAVNHFTQTFKPRFIEMATSDIDLSVRLGVIQVLLSIDQLALLEDEERDKLCLLIFAQDVRVRKAVAPFVQRTWAEEVEQHLVGRPMTGNRAGKERQRAGAKCLSQQFIKWSQALDKEKTRRKSQDDEPSESDAEGETTVKDAVLREFALDKSSYDRIGLAVDALWEDMEYIRRWNGILDLLLMDHTNEVEASESPSRKRRPGLRKEDSVVEHVWRLTEQEEDILLHVLVAALRRATEDAKSRPKGERSTDPDDEEASLDDVTLALIKALPTLFVKHQTDVTKISKVLIIPQLMNIGMYLEMRMITAYEALWDDISKQFLTHSSHDVIRHSVLAMKHMFLATSLQNTNRKKLGELEEEMSMAIKLLAGSGKNSLKQLATKTFDEDSLHAAGLTVYRISTLLSVKDLVPWLEDNDSGKGIRPLDVFSALVERAKLGHQREDRLIEQAIYVLFSFILWKSHSISAVDLSSAEGHALQQSIKQQRDPIIEMLIEYLVGENSQVTKKVKQAAFLTIIRLHMVFGPSSSHPDLHIEMEEQTQHRLAGYVQAVIDEYAEELEEIEDQDSTDGDSDVEMDEENKKKRRKTVKKNKEVNGQPEELSSSRLEKDYVFHSLLAPFIQAIRTETISFEHSSIILAHYGRFGDMYDQLARVLVEMLRTRWQQGDGQEVTSVVQRAMREAFMLRINDRVESEDPALSLSRLLASHFIVRGAHLAVLGRLPNPHLMDMHTYLIDFLVKKAGESQDDDAQLASVASLFRALAHLVPTGTPPQESLKLKSHLENALDKAGVNAIGTDTIWDGLRVYERKLVNAPKEKAATGRKRGKGKKGAMSEDEQVENALTSEDDGAGVPRRQNTRTRPMRSRAAKSKASDQSAASSEAESEAPAPSGRRKPRRDATPDNYDAEEPEDLPVILNGSPPRSPPKSSPSKVSSKKRVHEGDVVTTPLSQKKRKEPDVPPPVDDDSEEDFIGRKFKRVKR
ncbi:related to Nuclear cohesin complex subunit [Serendipita indica DSM 11827]|uniref:Related to Nuclear cohesin complex subunit n=1 Tax=Serendipita indica (strain DSM 11827) TaxID=1109443 RepID=G4TRB5_SERID|nr:related to Nuclear cohesin complex subunit [Serendipita indica DSM 11827]